MLSVRRGRKYPGFYADGTAYIFLCPIFHQLPGLPETMHCPTTDNNRFEGDQDLFYRDYQVYMLLGFLIRFALGDNALDVDIDPMEQIDWNVCVHLNYVDSVRNPTNTLLYAARKSLPPLLVSDRSSAHS